MGKSSSPVPKIIIAVCTVIVLVQIVRTCGRPALAESGVKHHQVLGEMTAVELLQRVAPGAPAQILLVSWETPNPMQQQQEEAFRKELRRRNAALLPILRVPETEINPSSGWSAAASQRVREAVQGANGIAIFAGAPPASWSLPGSTPETYPATLLVLSFVDHLNDLLAYRQITAAIQPGTPPRDNPPTTRSSSEAWFRAYYRVLETPSPDWDSL